MFFFLFVPIRFSVSLWPSWTFLIRCRRLKWVWPTLLMASAWTAFLVSYTSRLWKFLYPLFFFLCKNTACNFLLQLIWMSWRKSWWPTRHYPGGAAAQRARAHLTTCHLRHRTTFTLLRISYRCQVRCCRSVCLFLHKHFSLKNLYSLLAMSFLPFFHSFHL